MTLGGQVLDQVKLHMGNDGTMNKISYNAKKNIKALDYILNKHPNREAILGANSSNWNFEVSDNLLKKISSINDEKRGASVVSALRTMGYDGELDTDFAHVPVGAVIGVAQVNKTILIDPNPFMFDGTTLKSTPALAQKSLEALGDGNKLVFLDEQVL